MSPFGATRLALAAALIALAPVALPGQQAAAQTCQVRGAIGDYWASVGGDRSFLGPCVTNETPVPAGVRQDFRGGSVYWSGATGARGVLGNIRVAYDAAGGPASRLGLPTTSELPTPSRAGAYNHFTGGHFTGGHFTGGSIYWSPSTGAEAGRRRHPRQVGGPGVGEQRTGLPGQ